MRKLVLFAAALAAASCGKLATEDDAGLEAGAVADAAPDVAGDASPPDADAGSPYGAFDDESRWQIFDLANLGDPYAQGEPSFYGTAFDGRYLYFPPSAGRKVARYDTQVAFDTTSAWSTFDVLSVSPDKNGYFGAGLDGRYVYFMPVQCSGACSVLVRYDTKSDFSSSTSWSTFDLAAVSTKSLHEFASAVFDGRYLYLVPYWDGIVERYDSLLPFGDAGSWSALDTGTLALGTMGFRGGVFDGRYVYFSPATAGSTPIASYGGLTIRYDTTAPFDASSSWQMFDMATLSASAKGFFGAGFDGRYVYYVPYVSGPGEWSGTAARYDTYAPFGASSSWSTFDTKSVGARGFAGAAFDGRFIYFAPNNLWDDLGVAVRYDTLAPFGDSGSWSTFAMTKLDPHAYGFVGAAFDGEHVYFVPSTYSIAVRFDARTPPAMPAGYSGSFF